MPVARVICCLCLALFSISTTLRAAALRLVEKGVEIEAGTMGRFVITYPALVGQGERVVQPLIEKQVTDAKTVLKYEGGGQVEVTTDGGRAMVMHFTGIAPDVTAFRVTMLIDFSYSNGGSWQVEGRDAQAFPRQKDKAKLFQSHGTRFTLKNFEGKQLTWIVPANTYLDLQDNREWNWNIFELKAITPYNRDVRTYRIGVGDATTPTAEQKILVDAFGQNATVDFPDKVKSLEELKADAAAEQVYYDSLQAPAFDAYGGLPGSGQKLGLKKTGFFHVEQHGDRWYLVDPEGNLFYLLGVCVLSPVDDFTLVKGRESLYEWLPPLDSEFRTAFKHDAGADVFSFHLANQIRKYGRPYDPEEYAARMVSRLNKWGFNAGGPFSPVPKSAYRDANFPYVMGLQLGHGLTFLPGVAGTWDPFDEKNRAAIDRHLAAQLPPRAQDPLLVGYYLSNEPLFEYVPRVVPRLDGKYAAKRVLVGMLAEKYSTIEAFNQAWGMQAGSFDELIDAGLPIKTPQAAADVAAFTAHFFETYYELVTTTVRKYDRNHMLIGNRFQAGTINNEQLMRIAGRYMDVISFNYYTYAIDSEFLTRIHRWSGRPLMLTEFYYDSPEESGLPGGGKDVPTQAARGLAYRNYVEQSAVLGFVVGAQWFTMVDQALTGRWFERYNGENANSGLIAVTDRPWKQMLQHVTQTNYGIYDVVLGERAAFRYEDPKFVLTSTAARSLSIPRAAGEVKLDGTAAGFPGTPAEQIPSARLVIGSGSGGVEASFKLCWDDDALYLLIHVVDPTPMQNTRSASMLWSGDAVELFIGPREPEQDGPLLFGDHQILLSAALDGQARWYFPRAQEQPEDCHVVVVPSVDGKGYTLQAAIPFTALGFTPTSGQVVRFDIGIDDSADGARRLRQLMWNGTDRNSTDRTAWGTATFLK